MTVFIINRLGTVHRWRLGRTCRVAAQYPIRNEVSPLQARVFKLPCCAECFPTAGEYRRILEGVAA